MYRRLKERTRTFEFPDSDGSSPPLIFSFELPTVEQWAAYQDRIVGIVAAANGTEKTEVHVSQINAAMLALAFECTRGWGGIVDEHNNALELTWDNFRAMPHSVILPYLQDFDRLCRVDGLERKNSARPSATA